MTMTNWRAASLAGLALGLLAGTAQAGSVGTAASALKASAETTSAVEKIAYRRCWWRAGSRHCRWYGHGGYRSYGHYYASGSGIGIITGIRF
jgi:hypothetical protein